MANTVIFPEQTVTGFFYNQAYAAYVTGSHPAPFTLVLGETYSVYWDGSAYECQAQDASAVNAGCVLVGNGSAYGLGGNNEPFAIVYAPVEDTGVFIASDDKTEHTIAIQRVAASEPSIVLKDLNGDDNTYADVEKVELNNTDGETVMFSKGEVIDEPLQINLDFTNGNQTVEAPEGYLVKSAVIAKPTDLLPENILKDKDIGGIVGTAELGGGGGDESAEIPAFCAHDSEINYNWSNTTASSVTTSAGVKIPSTSDVWAVKVSTMGKSGSGAPQVYLDYSLNTKIVQDATVTENNDNTKTVSYRYTYTFTKGYEYVSLVQLLVIYTVPGLVLKTNENDELILYADSRVNVLTDTDHSKRSDIVILDLSNSSLSEVPSSICQNATQLRSVALPPSINSIGRSAFSGCTGLTTFEFPETLTEIGAYAFQGASLSTIYVPDGVTTMGQGCFQSCQQLSSVRLPQTLSGSELRLCFKDCPSLESIEVPGVNTLYSTFEGCTNLKNVLLHEGLVELGGYTFRNCTSLETITLPTTTTTMGEYSFYGCTNLKTIVAPSVSSLGNYAFQNCTSLETVDIPSARSFGIYCFGNCTSLKSMNIPEGMATVGRYVFYSCSSLNSITFPSTLTSIGNYAFFNISNACKADFTKCTSVPTLGTNNFTNRSSELEIRVPAVLYDEWIAATNWSALANYIVAVDTVDTTE